MTLISDSTRNSDVRAAALAGAHSRSGDQRSPDVVGPEGHGRLSNAHWIHQTSEDDMKISLTTFVDFSAKVGTPRVTHVRQAIESEQQGYQPAHDFYKPIREAIIDLETHGRPVTDLRGLMSRLTDKKKITNYPPAISGYESWRRQFTCQAIEAPPTRSWSSSGLSVRVNPELGFEESDGTRLAVKLYFKADQMSKRKLSSALHLLELGTDRKWKPALLDVRRGKLHIQSTPPPGVDALLASDAAAFVSIWGSLGGPP